jgi:hypothetical protein
VISRSFKPVVEDCTDPDCKVCTNEGFLDFLRDLLLPKDESEE